MMLLLKNIDHHTIFWAAWIISFLLIAFLTILCQRKVDRFITKTFFALAGGLIFFMLLITAGKLLGISAGSKALTGGVFQSIVSIFTTIFSKGTVNQHNINSVSMKKVQADTINIVQKNRNSNDTE